MVLVREDDEDVGGMGFDSAEAGASTFVDLIAPAVHEVVLNGTALDTAAVFRDSRSGLDGLVRDLAEALENGEDRDGRGAHLSRHLPTSARSAGDSLPEGSG